MKSFFDMIDLMEDYKPQTVVMGKCKECGKVLEDILNETTWILEEASSDYEYAINENFACDNCDQSNFKLIKEY